MSEWSKELPTRPGWYVYLGQLDALPTLILLVLTEKGDLIELFEETYFDVSRHVGQWLSVTLPEKEVQGG